MSIFKKRHLHNWEVVHKTLAERTYHKRWGDSKVNVLVKLERCSGCGQERAWGIEPGVPAYDLRAGEPLDVDFYKLMFMKGENNG